MAKLKIDKLIEYAYLREECDLPDVIIDEELEHPIYRAQETLRMLMSDGFYQDYLSAYKNLPLSTAYASLFPYVKQFLAWQAHEFWVVKANFKVHASGFRVHSEQNSAPPTDIQMATIIKDAKYQSNYYKKIMVDFLNNHASDYPLYNMSCRNDKTGNGFHISAVKNKNKHESYSRGKCCG